jgi:tetratricopeptide (TPR) repeat protein
MMPPIDQVDRPTDADGTNGDQEGRTVEYPSKTKGRRRARRLSLILGLAAILLVGWKIEPRVEARIRLELAERALTAGRLEEAEVRLDLLIEEEPRATRPRLLRARVARKLGQITEAEEILQRAIELGLPVEEARPEHDLLRLGDEKH